MLLLQQEKEALDDISMELELADEDEPVLFVISPRLFPFALRLTPSPCIIGIVWERPSSTSRTPTQCVD